MEKSQTADSEPASPFEPDERPFVRFHERNWVRRVLDVFALIGSAVSAL